MTKTRLFILSAISSLLLLSGCWTDDCDPVKRDDTPAGSIAWDFGATGSVFLNGESLNEIDSIRNSRLYYGISFRKGTADIAYMNISIWESGFRLPVFLIKDAEIWVSGEPSDVTFSSVIPTDLILFDEVHRMVDVHFSGWMKGRWLTRCEPHYPEFEGEIQFATTLNNGDECLVVIEDFRNSLN